MEKRANVEQFQLRMPLGMRDWLADEAARNASSMNSEIVRAVRERMDRIGASIAKRKAVAKRTA